MWDNMKRRESISTILRTTVALPETLCWLYCDQKISRDERCPVEKANDDDGKRRERCTKYVEQQMRLL